MTPAVSAYAFAASDLRFLAVDIPLWARLCVGIGLATPLAYFATPAAIGTARRFAFYDLPAGDKGHSKPTPYLGGLAVMAAFAIALLIGAGDLSRTLPVLGGVGILLVLGTVDDRRTVPPGVRVAVEFGLGAWLAAEGLGWRVGSAGWVGTAVTGVWVVAVVNAFNLFDNMDGAASSMASVVAAGACVLALVTGDAWVAAGSAALCGACLGFLPYNMSSPAKVFLGDGGSLPLGFAVAALVAAAARSAEPSSLALFVGLLLVGIPALDTSLVIVSRLRRGVSILTGGQDHLTHRTRRRWRTSRRVALVLGGAQGIVSGLVIVASREGSGTVVGVTLAFVVFAAAEVVILEATSTTEPGIPAVAGSAEPAGAPGASWLRLIPAVCLGAIGLGSGMSPLFSAYYNPDIWVPIGLVLVVVSAVVTIGRPPHFTLPVTLSLVGLSGLGLWSLLSMGWAHAVEQATVDGNLWISYAALLGVLVALIRRVRHARWLLAAVGVGIVVVGLSVLVRMLGGHPGTLFISGRLNSPLGYINGEGCVFAMGGWLTLALAERRAPAPAGVGMAATVSLMCLALLSQSRGTAVATFVALLVVLGAVPGWRRRVFALSIVVAGVAVAAGPILDVYRAGQIGPLPLSLAHHAAGTIALASVGAGLVWALLVGIAGRTDRGTEVFRRALLRCGTVLAAGLIATPLVAAVVTHSTIQRDVRTQWHEFTHLAGPTGPSLSSATVQTRLLSGSGNRYDYWRVAWHVFTAHPIAGVGAGNYGAYYFRQRATVEAIQNPHSIELQTLSELGLIGAILLAMTVGGAVIGAGRLRIRAQISDEARTTMVAATGVAIVWIVDTSGDWMHLLPGVSAAALCSFAVLCRAGGTDLPASPRRHSHLPRRRQGAALAGAAGVTFVMAVGGASLVRTAVVQHYLDDAHSALAVNPGGAVDDAQRALDLDGENLEAYYVKAAGQARFDRAAAARATLRQATTEDPDALVTWTLLGDLETRAGNFPAAHRYYRRALDLDPREPSLRALVARPGPH